MRLKVLSLPVASMVALSIAAAVTGAALASHADEPGAAEHLGLPEKTVEDAAAYADFVGKATAVDSRFKNASAVRRALKTGAAYESGQLQSGEVAYAALLALKSPRFVQGLGELREQGRADQLADRLLQNPASVLSMPGAANAAADAARVLNGDGQHLFATGAAVKQAAYTIQHQAWSRSFITDRPQRLAQVKGLSETRFAATSKDTSRLLDTLARIGSSSVDSGGQDAGDGYSQGTSASPVVTRGLALAALAVLGRARNLDERTMVGLASDTGGSECLKLAKLNLFQCLAVAGPKYEDVFCLGEHGLKETGTCLSKAATSPAVFMAPVRASYPAEGASPAQSPSGWSGR